MNISAPESNSSPTPPTTLNPAPSAIYIIGAGGVASYLLPPLLKLLKGLDYRNPILIVDGDTLEARNLDRQLFNQTDIGRNKAEALATLYPHSPSIQSLSDYFLDGSIEPPPGSLFFVCVDNHPARRAVLSTADIHQASVILAGNEYTDAEAYPYFPDWRGTELDPRIYYPELLTQTDGDPTRAATGCTGLAQMERPQLALANFAAAHYALHLFWFYFVEAQHLDADALPYHPIRLSNNFSRCATAMRGEFKRKKTA
jgi:hypothetical protein